MSAQGGSTKSLKPRSGKRGLRTPLKRLATAGVFLLVYLLFAVVYLDGSEAPGQDDNIVALALGAAVVTALGALSAPLLPLLLKGTTAYTKKQSSRSRSHQSHK